MEIALSKLVLVLCLCSFIFASEGQDDPIKKICSSARNPNKCFEFFKGDAGKSLPQLAEKAISQAGINAINTQTILTILTKGSNNPTLKGKYEACSKDYIWILRDLDRALKSVQNFKAMGDFTLAAIVNVDDCVRKLGGAPVSPPNLNVKIEDIRNLCSMALIISAIQ